MFLYNEPTVETADEIETKQKLIDEDFIALQTKFDQVNDVATEQKKEKKIEDLIDSVIDDKNPFSIFDDIWWEDEMFSKKDSIPTLESSKTFLNEINEMSDNIRRNLRPVDNRTEQELIDDQFISTDDRTQQELEDDDYISLDPKTEQELKDDDYISINDRTEQELKVDEYISLESDSEVENVDLTSAWDTKKPL